MKDQEKHQCSEKIRLVEMMGVGEQVSGNILKLTNRIKNTVLIALT